MDGSAQRVQAGGAARLVIWTTGPTYHGRGRIVKSSLLSLKPGEPWRYYGKIECSVDMFAGTARAQRLSSGEAWVQVVCSGSLAHRQPLRRMLEDRFRRHCRTPACGEETLTRLLIIALAISGGAGNIQAAAGVLREFTERGHRIYE